MISLYGPGEGSLRLVVGCALLRLNHNQKNTARIMIFPCLYAWHVLFTKKAIQHSVYSFICRGVNAGFPYNSDVSCLSKCGSVYN